MLLQNLSNHEQGSYSPVPLCVNVSRTLDIFHDYLVLLITVSESILLLLLLFVLDCRNHSPVGYRVYKFLTRAMHQVTDGLLFRILSGTNPKSYASLSVSHPQRVCCVTVSQCVPVTHCECDCECDCE